MMISSIHGKALFNDEIEAYNGNIQIVSRKGGISVTEQFHTTQFRPVHDDGLDPREILLYVYQALRERGYDPIVQIVGYMISGDPAYITNHKGARNEIVRLRREDILEELLSFYLQSHAAP